MEILIDIHGLAKRVLGWNGSKIVYDLGYEMGIYPDSVEGFIR